MPFVGVKGGILFDIDTRIFYIDIFREEIPYKGLILLLIRSPSTENFMPNILYI